MYHLEKSVFVLIGVLLLLSSCDHTPQQAGASAPETTDSIARILLSRKHIYPFYMIPADSSRPTFLCLYDANTTTPPGPGRGWLFPDTAVNIYAALVHINDTILTITANKQFIAQEWTYCTIDSTIEQPVINNKPYLYLSYHTAFQGTAVTERTLWFTLIDKTTLDHHTLAFEGTPSWKCADCLEGKLVNEEELARTPELLKFLRQKAAASASIYHPGEKDNDPYSTINYETKWEKDNDISNHYANGMGTINVPVKTTLYKTNLFDLQQGSLYDSVANDKYIFKSYFCGSVIGYDKERSLYFPLLVESCNGMCSKNILLSGDELTIAYSSDTFKVPLQQIIYDNTPGKD